jgi:hypothetical protein
MADGPTDPVGRVSSSTPCHHQSVEKGSVGTLNPVVGQSKHDWGVQMIGSDRARQQRLVGEETVYAALAAIDQALEQAMAAQTESRRRRELAQLRGLLLIVPYSSLGLEGALRHLIGTLQEPVLDR